MGLKKQKLFWSIVIIFALVIISKVGIRQIKDTFFSAPYRMGMVDITKVVQAHPKYRMLQSLQYTYDKLLAETERAGTQRPEALNNSEGLNEAVNKQSQIGMLEAQKRMEGQLEIATREVDKSQAAEMLSYTHQVDAYYQVPIVNIQLKLKMVELSKDEINALQAELEKLQKERAEKIGFKQRELMEQREILLSSQRAEMQKQGDQSAQEANKAVTGQLSERQAEMARQRAGFQNSPYSLGFDEKQQLAWKREEITVLREWIVSDVLDKAGKVAAQQGFDLVLAAVKVNAHAVDITDDVIAEVNK